MKPEERINKLINSHVLKAERKLLNKILKKINSAIYQTNIRADKERLKGLANSSILIDKEIEGLERAKRLILIVEKD